MPWFPLSDELYRDPRFAGLTGDGLALWTRANSWCADRLTDGLVPSAMLATFSGATPDHAAELVDAGVWKRARGGFQVVDWPGFLTKEAVTQRRTGSKVRKALYRDSELTLSVRERDGDTCRYCGRQVKWSDRRGQLGGTYDHVIPVKSGGKSTLDNLVVACRACNSRKCDRTPEQARMSLNPPPDLRKEPSPGTSSELGRNQPRPSSGSAIPNTYSVPNGTGGEAAPDAVTVQTVVAAWVDAVNGSGSVKPSPAMKSQVGKEARDLLADDDVDPTLLLEAARSVGGRGYATLHREVMAMQRRNVHPLRRTAGSPFPPPGYNADGSPRRDPKTGVWMER